MHRIINQLTTNHPIKHTVRLSGLRCMSTSSIITQSTSSPSDGTPLETTQARPFSDIPGPKGLYNIPVIGFLFHLKPFSQYTTKTYHLLIQDMARRYGDVFLVRTDVPTVVISNPKDYATVVRHEGKFPIMPDIEILDLYYKRTGSPRGVGAIQGQEWYRMRQPIQKTILRPKQLSCYLPLMNDVADEFVNMLASDYLNDHDVNTTFMNFTAETAGAAFFNKRLGFLNSSQTDGMRRLQRATHDVFRILQKTLSGASNAFRYYRSKDYRSFEDAFSFIRGQIGEFVRAEKDEMIRNRKATSTRDAVTSSRDVDSPSVLRSLLKETTEADAFSIMETLYPGAIDSSSAALQIILHTLATHPAKQEKLRREIFSVLGESLTNGDSENIVVTQQHLDKMEYLKAFVKESFRYRTVSMFTTRRRLSQEIVLGGYRVPAGVQIMYISSKASRDQRLFDNPERFEPERWLRGKSNKGDDCSHSENTSSGQEVDDVKSSTLGKDMAWAIHPFGIGARSCPGRRLFEQEAYLFLTKILHRLQVGLEPDSPDVRFEYSVFLRFVTPPRFVFTPVTGPSI